MKPGDLLKKCENVLKTFNPSKTTVDAHCLEMIGPADGPDAPPESVFTKQVVYGCVRYKAP